MDESGRLQVPLVSVPGLLAPPPRQSHFKATASQCRSAAATQPSYHRTTLHERWNPTFGICVVHQNTGMTCALRLQYPFPEGWELFINCNYSSVKASIQFQPEIAGGSLDTMEVLCLLLSMDLAPSYWNNAETPGLTAVAACLPTLRLPASARGACAHSRCGWARSLRHGKAELQPWICVVRACGCCQYTPCTAVARRIDLLSGTVEGVIGDDGDGNGSTRWRSLGRRGDVRVTWTASESLKLSRNSPIQDGKRRHSEVRSRWVQLEGFIVTA
ncbi:hypothetical protein DFH94DRAFT_848893 [Russula ochroleuca]|uniref:Uncharacterized protein n=1 Tax=Russula ochroleuca TaxID=152965 RepID=A0A9P5JUQ3_9AGAM|nr:hypothetical protein DFH94DRAFT_848893 [Russula ochroleuca]